MNRVSVERTMQCNGGLGTRLLWLFKKTSFNMVQYKMFLTYPGERNDN